MERVDENGPVGDTLLQEVAEPLGMLLEQLHGIGRLDVLRQQKNSDRRVELTDASCRDDSFIRVCRRHPDVDDRAVWLVGGKRTHQVGLVADFRDDIDAFVAKHADASFPHQHHVPADGSYVICDTFFDETLVNEPIFDLPCGTVRESSFYHGAGTRWYVDGLLVKRHVAARLDGTWSLSPTGAGPTLKVTANYSEDSYWPV